MQNHTIDSNGLLHVDNLSVGGSLYLSGTGITTLPDNLSVGGSLDLSGTGITTLPDNLSVGGSLYLSGTGITTLPDNLSVGEWLDLSGTGITTLPDNLSVGEWLDLSGTGITTLPDNLSVGEWLDLDVENYINVSYKQNCGASGRTIFAVKLRESIKIAAGCFLGTYDEFCNAVDELYTGEAAEQYKQDGKEIVCTLQNKL